MTSSCAIGGYFELELGSARNGLHHEALRFQSARAAFVALLCARRPAKVWLPRYVCDALLAAPLSLGIAIAFYDIDEQFMISPELAIGADELIVCVNYFGLYRKHSAPLIERFGSERVVCDYSQAYFCPPASALATLYSPRKFFGIPDGGLLHSSVPIALPAPSLGTERDGLEHLLKRRCFGAEAGYADFLAAEQRFDDTTPRAMAALSHDLLSAVDLAAVAERRRQNFGYLHARLQDANALDLTLDNDDVPLCYPLLIDNSALRSELTAARIYAARYWPEVEGRSKVGSFERRLAQHMVALPCDQRYGEQDMARVAAVVEACL